MDVIRNPADLMRPATLAADDPAEIVV